MSEPAAPLEATPDSKPADHAGQFTCPNCGRENHGKFCAACGQKHLHPGDLSLRHVWHDIVHELIHLDGKIVGTLWLLVKKPGQLTLDFLQGRRARHIHPLRLFLVIGAVYFLFAKGTSSPVDLSASFDRNMNPAGRINLERALANSGLTIEQFIAQANARVASLFKSVYITAVLLHGFWLWLMFRRKFAYLAEHMVLALHLASFTMGLWIVFVSPAHFFGVSRWITVPSVLLAWLGYFLAAGRRVYSAGWWGLIGAWLVLTLSNGIIMGTTSQVVTRRVLADSSSYVTVRTVTAEPASNEPIAPTTRTPLFNGQSIAGWIFVGPQASTDVASVWSVANGEIHCTGVPQGYLRTAATYRDYVLRFEWRWSAAPGNSGVFVHVQSPDKIWPACFEIQLKAGDAGSVRTNGGLVVKEVLPPATNPRQVSRRTPGTEKPPGEWNSAEVICRGDRITVTINGTLQTEVTQASATEGAIALQSEGAPIAFRNLELNPLP